MKKAVLAFFNAPNPAQVRVRLRQIKRLRARFAGGASLPRLIRLFFNSLLVCLGRYDPHLLLLELMMPGLDGFGIVWELDRQGLLPAQRIIVLTMMGAAEIARRGGLPPGVGLLAHPLDGGALHAALDHGMAAIPGFR